ncbi:uncharacterized protein LOC108258434 isoform X2 [Ictalurus punctatus]|nr:uncharacterized protein LOC108258434 isoform X2 [Ictalurus punctatus]XP_017312538.1 uncharacterized protein LOC108258434 isoform X2 [Ictalurus punctatus]
MVNSSCGTEPHFNRVKEPECETVQFKESDKEVYISAAEQEAVSAPVVILSDVTRGDAVSDRLQSTELLLESANLHEIDPALIDILPEVKQDNVTKMETEEHSADIKNEPQDQPDLEEPAIKLLGELGEVENATKTTSSPEPQTSHKDQCSPNPCHERSLDVDGDGVLFQEIEETKMDQKAGDHDPEILSGAVLEHLVETYFNSEMQLQATEGTEILEPPAKKRLRRRMGMCGLGDRKRRFPFDGQHCRQGLIGREREEGPLKGNKCAQHLHDPLLENDGTTPMKHEGTTRPACQENEEVLKNKENNSAAVIDDKRTPGEAEKEQKKNMNKCTALMRDGDTTDESPTENRDVLEKVILEENDGIVIMDNKGTTEQVVSEHHLKLLEDISPGVGQTLLSPTIGKNLNMSQDERSVAAATSDHEIETATCGEEPNVPGTDMTNNRQDIEFNMKHDVLPETQHLHADYKVGEDPDEIAMEDEVAQEVICSSVCATVEKSEGCFIVTRQVREVPTGLEESEMEIEEWCPSNMAPTEKHDPNGPELGGSTEKGLDARFVDSTGIASIEIHHVKGHCENDKPITAVSGSTEPAGGDAINAKQNSEPLAPPTVQEKCMQCLLDQNHCDTSVTSTVAEQQVCNPTLTPAPSEASQETGLSVPSSLYSMTDSQLHKIALSMELEDQPIPEGCDHQEDATELVRGLIRELSSINRTVMAAHREMELLRRGKLLKAPNRRLCGPRHTEM